MHALRSLVDRIPISKLMLILPLFYIGLLVAAKIFPVVYSPLFGVLSIYELLYYFQFFIFGMAMKWNKALFIQFSGVSILSSIFALISLIAFRLGAIENVGLIWQVLAEYTNVLIVWLACCLIFSAFRQLLNKPSAIGYFMANVSYTVYIFHHILVVILGLWMISMGFTGLAAIAALTIVILGICTGIHFL